MTKDIFIFNLTLIFFPFQEKPGKERIMLSVINNTKKQRKKHTMQIFLKCIKKKMGSLFNLILIEENRSKTYTQYRI